MRPNPPMKISRSEKYILAKKLGVPLARPPSPNMRRVFREVCSISGCYGKHRARGLCHKHWQRFQKSSMYEIIKIARHGLSKTKEYKAWDRMKSRCYRTSHPHYRHYGGRGIKVCDKWLNDPVAFIHDMGSMPSPKHSLDRIDVNGDYSPDNCQWSTAKEQASNRRTTRRIIFRGQTKCLLDWARGLGMAKSTLWHRLYRDGWTVERTLTTPPTH